MQVILLERVENLGKLGDEVRVKSGYARNFLVPHKKAVYATAANKTVFEARRAELEKVAAEHLSEANARRAQIDGLSISIAVKVSGEGKLFGSVGVSEIAHAIAAKGHTVEKREIRLPPTGPIRVIGEYEIVLHLHSEVDVTVPLKVVAEGEAA